MPSTEPDPETRYVDSESVTFAFLLALEALGPRQRAALLLRDVVGLSARETAETLSTSEANVRVLHHRARRTMEAYDHSRCVPTLALKERHRVALEALLAALDAQDGARVEALLSDSARTLTDAGGRYTALPASLEGRHHVARFYLAASRHRRAGGTRRTLIIANGLPAALVTVLHPVRRQAPHTLLRCELDEAGRIARIHALLEPRKLAGLAFPT
jgi:RNA polymerase sigma-70 factor (ECF subfamily)